MYGTLSEVQAWQTTYAHYMRAYAKTVVLPPLVYLSQWSKTQLPYPWALGAQTASHHPHDTAHTGDVSWAMLKDVGCSYGLMGHMERPWEIDTLAPRLALAERYAITPIICWGDPDPTPLLSLLSSYQFPSSPCIAYEPSATIGAQNSTPLIQVEAFAQSCAPWPVIYGGSVNAKNIALFWHSPYLQGVLVGRATFAYADLITALDASYHASQKSFQ